MGAKITLISYGNFNPSDHMQINLAKLHEHRETVQ